MDAPQPPRLDQVWICRRNIERFLKKLAEQPDESEREVLLDLLAREENKLKQLEPVRVSARPRQMPPESSTGG